MSYSFHQVVELAQPYTQTMTSFISSPTAPSTSMSYSFHQAVQLLAQPYTETMTSSIASPTAPSTSSSSGVYDVFLSFRGEDTRNTFTAHLRKALVGKGLRTYMDEHDLKGGDEISPALLQAIEGSRISIIVLSKDYALSTWCLDELLKILQCKESKQQTVLPIFYHVDPSDVRHQRKSFEEALAKHAEKLNGNMKKLQMWKNALQEVANLSGYHLTNGNESKYIEEIAQGVSRMANEHLYLDVAKHPVGLEPHAEAVNSLLNVGENDVRMVGIFGAAGMGKTTLAKAIYNSIMFRFEARCFLVDVSNISNKAYGLVRLQNTLLSEIFGDCRSLKVGNIDAGINIIKHRLRSKRVLLILDNVDDRKQLEKLAGARDWFGEGSRILITTRNRHLLTTHGVDSTYEMTGLNRDHAIQLFCWHAFKKKKPVDGYEKFVEQIIDYAGSLPLVLTMLGSDLCGRSRSEWICALDQYKKSPLKDLQKILRPIYDQLIEDEKNILLDIACFFTGDWFDDVIRKLDSFGFRPNFWIPRLEEKCLISNFRGVLQMHDILRDIGREVVRQESPKKPEKRSRLFIYEDIRDVLEEATGTDNIEAIMIDLPKGNHKNIHLSPKAFKKMKRLRFFKCNNVHFSGDHLDYLPRGIKVLEWPKCPLQSMPSTFRGDELVILRMPQSLMREISWESKNLTVMNFEGCEFLTKISDLSGCPNLKEININYCWNLVEVHDSVGLLDQLVEFIFSECYNLKIFPKIFRLRSLKVLDGKWTLLPKFPKIECEMEYLRVVKLSGCQNLKRLPSEIIRSRSLEHLDLRNFPIISLGMEEEEVNNGQSLPNIMSTMEIKDSSSEELFPLKSNYFWQFDQYCFPNLNFLNLSRSNIQSIPASFKSYVRLKFLHLSDCKELKEIIEFPPNLYEVDARRCISLESLPEMSRVFPFSWDIYQTKIDLSGCYKLNMEGNCMPNPTWNSRQMMFPGNKIPVWFNYCKEASNSHWCEFDIEVSPPYPDDIVGIAFCAVIQSEMNNSTIQPHRPLSYFGYNLCRLYTELFGHENSYHFHQKKNDNSYHHVWLGYMEREDIEFGQDVDNLRIIFESTPNSVMFKRCGVHLLYKNHEQKEKDLEGIGNLANPMDGGQLSKRRRVDSDHYNGDNGDACNIASNLSTQQMKTSLTLPIRIGELHYSMN